MKTTFSHLTLKWQALDWIRELEATGSSRTSGYSSLCEKNRRYYWRFYYICRMSKIISFPSWGNKQQSGRETSPVLPRQNQISFTPLPISLKALLSTPCTLAPSGARQREPGPQPCRSSQDGEAKDSHDRTPQDFYDPELSGANSAVQEVYLSRSLFHPHA